MCVASTLSDKVDPASWIARKNGYAGWTNPSNVLRTRIEGATFGGSGLTDTEKRAKTMNQTQAARIAAQPRHSGKPAHAVLNEAAQGVSIAGRRGPGRG